MSKTKSEFVEINGFPLYEINKDGVIRRKITEYFKVRKDIITKPKQLTISLHTRDDRWATPVKHNIDRLVYEHFSDDTETIKELSKFGIKHLDGDRFNNNIDNLQVTTSKKKVCTVFCEFCHNSVKNLSQHKQSLLCQELQSRLLHKACKENNVERAKYICKNGYLVSLCIDTFSKVCENGHLEVANWLWETFRPNLKTYNSHYMLDYHDKKISIYDKAFYESCDNGHIDVAKWLVSIFPEKYQLDDNNEPVIIEN